MKYVFLLLPAVTLVALCGCKSLEEQQRAKSADKVFLTVDFQPGQSLRYNFICSREIEINWGSTKSSADSNQSYVSKSSESMEMIISYTPTEVDSYGLTTVKAVCESVKAMRTLQSARSGVRNAAGDAVEYLAGKSFTLTVDSAGKIQDYSELDELIKEAGKRAFRPDTPRGRIKEPDMICDFVATQWFLWDSVSSIDEPAEGLKVGQTWMSKLSVPTPMVTREARDVTYRLDEIRRGEECRQAVIRSTYALADSAPNSWPIPYSGTFQVSGTYGFFRGYKIRELSGQGEELFNIDHGRIEQYNQQYQVQLDASLLIPLGPNPGITIKQNITMKLLQ